MKNEEIKLIKEKLEAIKRNCEEQIAINAMDEFAKANWQHAAAIAKLKLTHNPASSENGKKGGRPRKKQEK